LLSKDSSPSTGVSKDPSEEGEDSKEFPPLRSEAGEAKASSLKPLMLGESIFEASSRDRKADPIPSRPELFSLTVLGESKRTDLKEAKEERSSPSLMPCRLA